MYRLVSDGGKRAIYILNDEDKCAIKATYIKQLTDLKVLTCNSVPNDFAKTFESSHVRRFVYYYVYFKRILNQYNKIINLDINLIVSILMYHTLFFTRRY